MPISILGLYREGEGETEAHTITISSLPDIELTKPFRANVLITKIRHDIFSANVRANVQISLECNRCLKRFTDVIKLDFTVTFSDDPEEEDWPIVNNQIDLDEPLRQEILLMPSRQLCETKCSGIHIT